MKKRNVTAKETWIEFNGSNEAGSGCLLYQVVPTHIQVKGALESTA